MRAYLYSAVVTLLGLLGAGLWGYRKAWLNSSENAREAESRAQAEHAAREHVEATVEATNEVDADMRGMSDDAVTDELRQYARDKDADH